jgi:hypothetical protein
MAFKDSCQGKLIFYIGELHTLFVWKIEKDRPNYAAHVTCLVILLLALELTLEHIITSSSLRTDPTLCAT